ncbi:helix-turn-helix domain-containing protein [Fervidibacillus albus]|uniref:Helix-turn-helix domain-containing protein n=1 Tax=Fervidibacillus albus TaxID=2980026 RepID=A0A9E8RW70_9BACI|nr:helix-turn-helix transcriptional regulator [Fervidibacillus albus]WAA10306.1 helix-turn-helix domain-containing protein [Fervidibacillus albus]
MQFGGILKAVRQKAGFSQEELAHRLNMNQSDISKIETDRKVPDAFTFIQWIQLTNTPEVMMAFLYGIDAFTIMSDFIQTIPIGGFIAWLFS